MRILYWVISSFLSNLNFFLFISDAFLIRVYIFHSFYNSVNLFQLILKYLLRVFMVFHMCFFPGMLSLSAGTSSYFLFSFPYNSFDLFLIAKFNELL